MEHEQGGGIAPASRDAAPDMTTARPRSVRRQPRRALTLLWLAGLVLAPLYTFASETPRLGSLFQQARLVIAGEVLGLETYADGRIVVAAMRIRTIIKGNLRAPDDLEVRVIEQCDLRASCVLKSGARGLAFLKPAQRTSRIVETVPEGRYYQLVGNPGSAWLVASSSTDLDEFVSIGQRVVGASRQPEPIASRRADMARELVFDLLAASHSLLVEEGVASLNTLPIDAATLTATEKQRIEHALSRQDLPSPVRIRLAGVVASRGFKQLVPVLQGLTSPPELVEAAWAALGQLGVAPEVEELERRLGSDQPELRVAAARELLRQRGADAIDTVAPVALHDPDRSVRLGTIAALGDLRDPAALAPLERVFSEAQSEIQQAAARAILKIGGRDAAESLGRLAFEAPPESQRYAVVVLMTMDEQYKKDIVQRIAATHPDETLRNLAQHGLKPRKY